METMVLGNSSLLVSRPTGSWDPWTVWDAASYRRLGWLAPCLQTDGAGE